MAQSVQLGNLNLTICILFEFEFEIRNFEFKTELVEIWWVYYIEHPESVYHKIIQFYEV